MRVLHLDAEPRFAIPYLNAGPKGRPEAASLPILMGRVDRLPDGIDGLLVAADLQGVVAGETGEVVLLGRALASYYDELSMAHDDLPSPERTGVILAGDLFSASKADVRGATGDVRSVWYAFADRFAFAAGVAGNHDMFGSAKERRSFEAEPGIHLLDGACAELDGLGVGGVSGIIGNNTSKNERKTEDDFLGRLHDVLAAGPEIVVLHQGPDGGDRTLRGTPSIREAIASSRPNLTVCGHVYWDRPLAEPDPGHQILNVDGRVVLLTATSR
jgi:hypothetical protein